MTRKSVTEEDFGLSPTEEEMATVVSDAGDADDGAGTVEEPSPAPATPAPVKADEPPKMVDVRALQEARAEAREAREQARILSERWDSFLAGQNAKPKAEEPAIPNGDDDPVNAVKWTQAQVLAMRQEQQDRTREQQEAQQRQNFQDRILADAAAEFQQSVATDPAVQKAYDALVASFRKEAEFYPGMTPQQRVNHMRTLEVQHLTYARQNRIPVANYIKGLASARGWTDAPVEAVVAKPAKIDLAATQAAQQRHQSLSDAPGGDAPAPLDAKALARMSDKDFKAWMSKKGNEQKFDEMMGG